MATVLEQYKTGQFRKLINLLTCFVYTCLPFSRSIAEKCFDILGILKIATVKSVEPGNNSFSINHIFRCRSNNVNFRSGILEICPGSDFIII